eukprot:gene13175-biopygen4820
MRIGPYAETDAFAANSSVCGKRWRPQRMAGHAAIGGRISTAGHGKDPALPHLGTPAGHRERGGRPRRLPPPAAGRAARAAALPLAGRGWPAAGPTSRGWARRSRRWSGSSACNGGEVRKEYGEVWEGMEEYGEVVEVYGMAPGFRGLRDGTKYGELWNTYGEAWGSFEWGWNGGASMGWGCNIA